MQSMPVLALLGILVLFFAWNVFRFMGKMRETAKNKNIVETKITELQQIKEKLNSNIAKLKTDAGLEESIREKFGLAKEGEGMIVVVEDKNMPEVPKNPDSGWFNFFKNWFR